MDFSLSTPNFSAVSVTITAETEAGLRLFSELFGHGAVSVEMPKSQLFGFAELIRKHGLKAGGLL